jgi:hypothetical protein
MIASSRALGVQRYERALPTSSPAGLPPSTETLVAIRLPELSLQTVETVREIVERVEHRRPRGRSADRPLESTRLPATTATGIRYAVPTGMERASPKSRPHGAPNAGAAPPAPDRGIERRRPRYSSSGDMQVVGRSMTPTAAR